MKYRYPVQEMPGNNLPYSPTLSDPGSDSLIELIELHREPL